MTIEQTGHCKEVDILINDYSMSIYKIHKALNVNYKTVWQWHKGHYSPSEENRIKLIELIEYKIDQWRNT